MTQSPSAPSIQELVCVAGGIVGEGTAIFLKPGLIVSMTSLEDMTDDPNNVQQGHQAKDDQ